MENCNWEDLLQILEQVRNVMLRRWRAFGPLAEDLAQEGVAKAWEVTQEWTGQNGARLRTFLTRVAINAGFDLLRKERRFKNLKRRYSENLPRQTWCPRCLSQATLRRCRSNLTPDPDE